MRFLLKVTYLVIKKWNLSVAWASNRYLCVHADNDTFETVSSRQIVSDPVRTIGQNILNTIHAPLKTEKPEEEARSYALYRIISSSVDYTENKNK